MHDKFAAQGLTVMTFSINPADATENKAKVEEFLSQQKAGFPHFVAATEADADKVTEMYSLGPPPAYVLIDRSGKRVELPEELTDDNLDELVRAAVAGK